MDGALLDCLDCLRDPRRHVVRVHGRGWVDQKLKRGGQALVRARRLAERFDDTRTVHTHTVYTHTRCTHTHTRGLHTHARCTHTHTRGLHTHAPPLASPPPPPLTFSPRRTVCDSSSQAQARHGDRACVQMRGSSRDDARFVETPYYHGGQPGCGGNGKPVYMSQRVDTDVGVAPYAPTLPKGCHPPEGCLPFLNAAFPS